MVGRHVCVSKQDANQHLEHILPMLNRLFIKYVTPVSNIYHDPGVQSSVQSIELMKQEGRIRSNSAMVFSHHFCEYGILKSVFFAGV